MNQLNAFDYYVIFLYHNPIFYMKYPKGVIIDNGFNSLFRLFPLQICLYLYEVPTTCQFSGRIFDFVLTFGYLYEVFKLLYSVLPLIIG